MLPSSIIDALAYYDSQPKDSEDYAETRQVREFFEHIDWNTVEIPVISIHDNNITLTWWKRDVFIIFDSLGICVDGMNNFEAIIDIDLVISGLSFKLDFLP